jgi:hypothetical protein
MRRQASVPLHTGERHASKPNVKVRSLYRLMEHDWRSCLTGLWELKGAKAGWQPWIKLKLVRA